MPDSLRSFKQHVRMLGPASEKVKSGLIDNLQAGVGTTRLDHLEYSGIYWQDFKEERRKAVYDGLQSGRWKDEDLMPFVGAARGAPTDLDYNRFAYWAKKQGHQDILTDEEIREQMGLQEQTLLGPAQETLEAAGPGGVLMYMAGSLAGYSTSPVTWASMLHPVTGAARGTTILGRTAMAVGKVMLTEAAYESIRQPLIANWRRELGRDYSVKEGLQEVAFAATGTGILGGAGELAKGIRRFRLKTKVLKGDLEKLSRDQLEDLEKILDNHLFPEQEALDHISRLEAEMNRLNQPGRTPPSGEGVARATPSRVAPPKGTPPTGKPGPPSGPRPPKSIVEDRIKDLDEQMRVVREQMGGTPGAQAYLRELEREMDVLRQPASSQEALLARAKSIEAAAKADADIEKNWQAMLDRVEEQITKVKKDMPAGPERQMYLEELDLEKQRLSVKRDVQRRREHDIAVKKMDEEMARKKADLADVPEDLADVSVFRATIDETGRMVERPSSLREAVAEINEEATQASKTWECMNAG